ncbi:MAG: hypothetical protein QOH29_970 [Actinomycetota bacterium]|nr:hypothetical protein [Actinomycetota bacterium]
MSDWSGHTDLVTKVGAPDQSVEADCATDVGIRSRHVMRCVVSGAAALSLATALAGCATRSESIAKGMPTKVATTETVGTGSCGGTLPPTRVDGTTATLTAPTPGTSAWTVAIANNSHLPTTVNKFSLDLVALNEHGTIIGAQRWVVAVAGGPTVAPGRSVTLTVAPVADDCTAPQGITYPRIPDGTYTFAAVVLLSHAAISSNRTRIRVSDGAFAPA